MELKYKSQMLVTSFGVFWHSYLCLSNPLLQDPLMSATLTSQCTLLHNRLISTSLQLPSIASSSSGCILSSFSCRLSSRPPLPSLAPSCKPTSICFHCWLTIRISWWNQCQFHFQRIQLKGEAQGVVCSVTRTVTHTLKHSVTEAPSVQDMII